jgi:hypothetical protein
MRSVVLIGVLLVVIGTAALLFGRFGYSDTNPVLKARPLQANATEQHSVAIPTIAGVVILMAAVGLIVAGRRGP